MIKNVFAGMALLALGALGLIGQMKPPTPDEMKGLQEIIAATTAETRIAAVDNFVKDFPASDYRGFALTAAAEAYDAAGNVPKAILYYQQVLDVDPKNHNAMLMLGAEIARTTRELDLDKEEKLAKAEKYARDGMALVPGAVKPNPQIPDEQWEGIKKDDLARGHEALGMTALARKKYDVAAAEFKTAAETASTVQSVTLVRLGSAYTDSGKPDEAIATLDKVLAMPNLNAQVKQVALAEKTRAEKAKASKN